MLATYNVVLKSHDHKHFLKGEIEYMQLFKMKQE